MPVDRLQANVCEREPQLAQLIHQCVACQTISDHDLGNS